MKGFPHDFSTARQAVIISVKQHPRRPDRYAIVLETEAGSRFKTLVSDEQFVRNVYREGDKIDVAIFLSDTSKVAAFDVGVDMLARRSCSSFEVQRAIARRGISRDVAGEAVARLTQLGLLNDTSFAAAFVRTRLENRRSSAWALRRDLAKKGVPRDIADAAIAEGMRDSGGDETDLARTEAEKKWKRLKDLDPRVARRKLAAFLQRRGFNADAIRAAIREVGRESE